MGKPRWSSSRDRNSCVFSLVSLRSTRGKDIKFLSLVEDHPVFPKNVWKNLLFCYCFNLIITYLLLCRLKLAPQKLFQILHYTFYFVTKISWKPIVFEMPKSYFNWFNRKLILYTIKLTLSCWTSINQFLKHGAISKIKTQINIYKGFWNWIYKKAEIGLQNTFRNVYWDSREVKYKMFLKCLFGFLFLKLLHVLKIQNQNLSPTTVF